MDEQLDVERLDGALTFEDGRVVEFAEWREQHCLNTWEHE